PATAAERGRAGGVAGTHPSRDPCVPLLCPSPPRIWPPNWTRACPLLARTLLCCAALAWCRPGVRDAGCFINSPHLPAACSPPAAAAPRPRRPNRRSGSWNEGAIDDGESDRAGFHVTGRLHR